MSSSSSTDPKKTKAKEKKKSIEQAPLKAQRLSFFQQSSNGVKMTQLSPTVLVPDMSQQDKENSPLKKRKTTKVGIDDGNAAAYNHTDIMQPEATDSCQ